MAGALSSRFRRRYALPDFDDDELAELLRSMLAEERLAVRS